MIRVIGLGTGRCGTHSLAKLLGLQDGASIEHERRPSVTWTSGDPCHFLKYEGFDLTGDVAFYYLPHVRSIWKEFPDTKFVCLRRDKQETVNSFFRCYSKEQVEQWFSTNSGYWASRFPIYKDVTTRNKVRSYWSEYYETAVGLENDRFRIFDTGMLNCPDKIHEMFRFIGVDNPKIIPGIRLSKTT
jgi:hypothetical protein